MFVGREGPEADQEGEALMVVTLQREYGLMHQGSCSVLNEGRRKERKEGAS